MLTPDVSGRQLSRESRVSIPYEARQYIASMGDSPRASPLLESHTPSPSQSTSGDQKRHEFTLGQAQQRHTDEPNLSATFIAEETPAGASGDSTPSDFLDLETDDGADDEDMEEDAGMGAVSPTGAAETGKSQADDFPLPPSFTDPQAHAQARAMAQAHAQAHAQAQAQQLQSQTPTQQARGAMRPPELLMPPGLHPSPSSSPVTDMSSVSPITNKSASFRALPLLPTDLPKTQIQVAHSSIRPNDRGKEVLSFVVHVDPGNGKESWKVEKLWSDVLGLDQRIRSSVGKGVVKKIGTLPEGKLWRDHAPAKVDQRKVPSNPPSSRAAAFVFSCCWCD
jgi:RalA-binding protein 1